jgi:hypothetical protein
MDLSTSESFYSEIEEFLAEERELRHPDRYDGIGDKLDELLDGLLDLIDVMTARKMAVPTLQPSVIVFN